MRTKLNEQEIRRILEMHKSASLKHYLKEDETTGCMKPTTSGRPNCTEIENAKTIGGRIFVLEGSAFMMYKDKDSGCPSYCVVSDKDTYKLS
jgi:hypothetical protein